MTANNRTIPRETPFFKGASLCFGHTKTSLCELQHPDGL